MSEQTLATQSSARLQRTALYERHRRLEAKMTAFHGWEMPLYYSSILEEHKAVREALGLFDISHMGQVLVGGEGALATLNSLMVSDISQVAEGRACYTLMLSESGGILDDLIVYRIGKEDYLLIVNCANRASDVAWLEAHRLHQARISDISDGRSILAVQGPLAVRALEQILDARVTSLARFGVAPIRTMGPDACLARTGYTGSDGFELFLPNFHAQRLWDTILAGTASLGALPVGLGARDTLRVEAGLRLHGADMDGRTSPFDAGLGWTVVLSKPNFIGKEALLKQKQQPPSRAFIGFELGEGPVPRFGMELREPTIRGSGGPASSPESIGSPPAPKEERCVGTVTSGTFSPVLGKPIGMGYVEPSFAAVGKTLTLIVRNLRHSATIVKLPFWKGPKAALK